MEKTSRRTPTEGSAADMIDLILECPFDDRMRCVLTGLGTVVAHYKSLGYVHMRMEKGRIPALKGIREIKEIQGVSALKACMDQARETLGADGNVPGDGGRGIGIAFLDTGVSPVADFLMPKNRIVCFRDFVYGRRRVYDDNGHGTQEGRVLS